MNDFQSIQTTTGSTLSQIASAAGMAFAGQAACVVRGSMASSHSTHGWPSSDTREVTRRPAFDTKAFMTSGTDSVAEATTRRALTPRALTPKALTPRPLERESSKKTSEGDSKALDAIQVQDTETEVIRA